MSLSAIETHLNRAESCRREMATSTPACVEPHKNSV